MGKVKKEVKEAVKQVTDKTPEKVYTTPVGPVDIGAGLTKSLTPEGKDKPFAFLGARDDESGNYGYARVGSGKDKQVGFGKSDERGSVGVDIGKDFIGVGGSLKFKKGGIARGCGKVLEDRRKVTKYY